MLYGPSGVGKSSVLRAGVARALREWASRSTEAEVAFVASWAGSPRDRRRSGLALDARSPRRGSGDIYLVLDQFEEFFLYHARGEAAELADALASCTTATPG